MTEHEIGDEVWVRAQVRDIGYKHGEAGLLRLDILDEHMASTSAGLEDICTLEELTAEAVKAERERIRESIARLLITPEEMAKADRNDRTTNGGTVRWSHNAAVTNALQLIDPSAPKPSPPSEIIACALSSWADFPGSATEEILQALASKGYKVVSE